jgi:repressor LexA
MMLTKKQYQLLIYIDKMLTENGISPSFDEMKDALNLKSKSGIHRLISGLEERGFIRRLPNRARALEVMQLPENADTLTPVHRPILKPRGFKPNVIKGDFTIAGSQTAGDAAAVQLPLYGKIAAGTAIEALRDNTNTVDIPADMLGVGEHYALEVEGESMIEAGIFDGDTVLIHRSDTAANGDIVVALVDDHEVTLKRIRRKGNSIALEPANSAYETRICGPDQVKVQGRLVGLLRRY